MYSKVTVVNNPELHAWTYLSKQILKVLITQESLTMCVDDLLWQSFHNICKYEFIMMYILF